MAYRDPPGKAVRPVTFRDLPELEDAELAAIVQVNVDARAIAPRQIKHQVKLALHIAVEGGRVKPADGRLDAELQGLFQQCRRAWRRAHAALRKSHKLDRNSLAHLLAQRQNHFQIGKVDFRIDIDVAAQRHRPLFNEQVNQRRCPSFRRRVDACTDIFLDGDALLDGAAFQVGNSRRAEQGLVEWPSTSPGETSRPTTSISRMPFGAVKPLDISANFPSRMRMSAVPPSINKPPFGRRSVSVSLHMGASVAHGAGPHESYRRPVCLWSIRFHAMACPYN